MARCVFCQKPFGPHRKRSAEHAYPKWIGDLLNARQEKGRHVIISSTSTGLTSKDVGYRSPFTDTIKRVCRPCNNGWMSELEGTAQPILSPLIVGNKSRTLHAWGQMVVATWATKTAMMLDFLSADSRAFLDSTLKSFYIWQRPMPGQQVFIGSYSGDALHMLATTRGVTDDHGGPEKLHIYTVTFSVGKLAVHILGHGPHENMLHWSPPKKLERAFLQIAPVAPEVVRYPPPMQLGDFEMERLLETFGTPPHQRIEPSDEAP